MIREPVASALGLAPQESETRNSKRQIDILCSGGSARGARQGRGARAGSGASVQRVRARAQWAVSPRETHHRVAVGRLHALCTRLSHVASNLPCTKSASRSQGAYGADGAPAARVSHTPQRAIPWVCSGPAVYCNVTSVSLPRVRHRRRVRRHRAGHERNGEERREGEGAERGGGGADLEGAPLALGLLLSSACAAEDILTAGRSHTFPGCLPPAISNVRPVCRRS